jgi:hypothetical protein
MGCCATVWDGPPFIAESSRPVYWIVSSIMRGKCPDFCACPDVTSEKLT